MDLPHRILLEMATKKASSSDTSSLVDDVDGLMAKLGLREEDLDGVVFEDVAGKSDEATRWLVIGNVHIETNFSHFWFFKK
jgi:hypothetical protein